MGVRPGDVAHVTLSYHIMPGGLRLHRAFEEAGCLVINGGTGNSQLQVELAQGVGRDGVRRHAELPRQPGRHGARAWASIRAATSHYRVGFSTAEALTPALRRELGRTPSASSSSTTAARRRSGRWPASAACTRACTSTRAISSASSSIRRPASRWSEGGTGELVATQLGPRALPLVRYAPGDVFRLLPGACACGDPSPRIVFVGQVGAIRKIKGVLVHPAQVHRALSEFPGVGRFQIVVDHPAGERYDRAVLRVGLHGSRRRCRRRSRGAIAARVKAVALIGMDVELVAEADLPGGAAAPRFADVMVDRREHA